MQIRSMELDTESRLDAVRSLLSGCGLPTADIASLSRARFLGVEDAEGLVAVVGLELWGDVALLRSLAVRPNQRGQGCGHTLVSAAEVEASRLGINQLFLLTMNAEDFFAKAGYVVTSRADAPAAIKGTQQFSGLCPDVAVLMHKRLDNSQKP